MKNRLSAFLFLLLTAGILSACGSPYSKFYQPIPGIANSPIPIVPFSGEPTVGLGSGDVRNDIRTMYEQGYGLIGHSNFVGPAQNQSGAVAQAKTVGAARVLIYSKYRNTVTGSIPITVPTATTSYSSGTVNTFGSGGYGTGMYSGTTTTYGTETTEIPYSVDKYEQYALFFAPLERTGLGILTAKLSDAERQALGSNMGAEITAVRIDSPAFKSDILPGDLLLSIGGTSVYDAATLRQTVTAARGHNTDVVLFRGGKKITKKVLVPDGDW